MHQDSEILAVDIMGHLNILKTLCGEIQICNAKSLIKQLNSGSSF